MKSAVMKDMVSLGSEFEGTLAEARRANPDIHWYPYRILSNLGHLQRILPDDVQQAVEQGSLNWSVLDVGAADGDLGFFFESRGALVDFMDFPTTNFNDLEALRYLRAQRSSPGALLEQDVDRGIVLNRTYNLVIALGLLYHLRNPMNFLMTLAQHGERMVLSTRVATQLPDGTDVTNASLAYFLGCRESNNDPTNFWVFTPLGLGALLKRSGWIVKKSIIVGASSSNPVDPDKDARMFAYCERVPNWDDLWRHHDF